MRGAKQMDLELLKIYAISLIGTPYFYGGDDPISGFDCSGFVSELARASGIAPWNFRDTAQGIYTQWKGLYRTALTPQLGDFVFYGLGGNAIEHVAFCLDNGTIAEAGGGDASTVNCNDMIAKNAFVRMRPIGYRRNLFAILRPIYPVILAPPGGKIIS